MSYKAVQLENAIAPIERNCTALQEVQLPDTLESIKSNAFENCSSLQRMHLPAAVSELSAMHFRAVFRCQK